MGTIRIGVFQVRIQGYVWILFWSLSHIPNFHKKRGVGVIVLSVFAKRWILICSKQLLRVLAGKQRPGARLLLSQN